MFIADTRMANKIGPAEHKFFKENMQLQFGIANLYSFHKLSKRNLYYEEFRYFDEI